MSSPATVKSFTCFHCSLVFMERKSALKHRREGHPKCKQCKTRFLSPAELQNHQQTTEHCYCRECDIYFLSVAEHLSHVRNVTHTTPYHCCDCGREYTNGDALHHHCCNCDKVLKSLLVLQRHFSTNSHLLKAAGMQPERHPKPLRKCEKCGATFRNKRQLKNHMSSTHIREVEVLNSETPPKPPQKCTKCDAKFKSKKQLKGHMSSSHNHIPCLTGEKCKKKFATPSALLNHLESGCCRSGMNSTKLRKLVFAHDQNRYITSVEAAELILSSEHSPDSQISYPSDLVKSPTGNPSRSKSPVPPLAADNDNLSEWSVVGGGKLTPTTSNSDWSLIGSNAFTPVYSDTASEKSFGSEYLVHISSNTFSHDTNLDVSSHEGTMPQKLRCNLCGPNRKPFHSVEGYQRHLNSAAHASKIFHCPLSLMPNVKPEDLLNMRHFSTLGGLTSHLEAGGCKGGLKLYIRAISFVEEQLKHLGFGDLMLLSN